MTSTDSVNPERAATEQTITLTPAAAAKVRALIEADQDDSLKLRVFVTGGGCSGFSYGFTFDTDVAEDDALLEAHGVGMLVDSLSYPYLAGSAVDFVEDLQGSQFVVRNPNAAATCGCGNSFAV